MLTTFVDVVSSPSSRSLELRQIDRIATRSTDATVERIFYNERPQHLMFVAAKDIEDKRLRLRVLAAGAATAEAARS